MPLSGMLDAISASMWHLSCSGHLAKLAKMMKSLCSTLPSLVGYTPCVNHFRQTLGRNEQSLLNLPLYDTIIVRLFKVPSMLTSLSDPSSSCFA
jgi:hypothetical protein